MKKPSKYWILLGTFFTSVSSIIIRFSEAPAIVIAAYRMLFTTMILFFPVYINKRSEFRGLHKNNYIMCIVSGVFLALHFATWIQSIQMTTIANSTILVSCSPIFVAAINYSLLKEKITKKMVLGIVMSLIGTVIIGMGSSQGTKTGMMVGNILAFMGGIVRKNISAGVYVFIVYSVSAIVLFIMCFITKTPVYPYPIREYMLFFFLAFFSSILGHTVYNYLMKYFSSTLISVSTLSEPLFASFMAMLIFEEIPSVYTIIGGIVIITGIYYYLITQNTTKREHSFKKLT